MKALGEYFLIDSNGGVHVVAEQSSCFCKCYVSFEQRNMAEWKDKKKMQATPGAHLSSKMLSNRELDINLGTFEVECFTLVI